MKSFEKNGAMKPLVLASGIVATNPLVLKSGIGVASFEKVHNLKLGATNPLNWKVELEATKPLVVLGLQTH